MAGFDLNVQRTELKRESTTVPSRERSLFRWLLSFVFWSHERGTLQYDVMVTLILLFVFLSPLVLNFKDRPVERSPHPSEVLVYPDGTGEFIYQVDGNAIRGTDDDAIRAQLLRIIEPVSGSVSITRYEPVKDKGRVVAYKVWIQRE
jgi:hypothetical protein